MQGQTNDMSVMAVIPMQVYKYSNHHAYDFWLL